MDDVAVQRALHVATSGYYVGILACVGLVAFERWIHRARPLRGRPARVAWAAWVLALASSLALIPLSAVRIAGLPLGSVADVTGWWPTVYSATVWAAFAVAVGGALAPAAARRRPGRAATTAVAVSAVVMLMAPVLTGHTRTQQPVWLIMLADGVHLLAGAFWVGGVIGLVLLLATGSQEESAETALAVVNRFSRGALLSVLALGGSGLLMASMILSAPAELLTDAYGRTLLLKLAVAGAICVVAAWNRLRLLPRLGGDPDSASVWSQLRRSLAYETALLALVLALTGALALSAPGHQGLHSEPSAIEEAARP